MQQIQQNKRPANLSAGGSTILVVDDFAAICKLIARRLNGFGFRTLTASDGRVAQSVILMHGLENIDLLITELELPRMRGEDLITWFLNEKPQGRVIMMSSFPENENCCENASFLKKPFHLHSLEAKIGEVFAESSANHNHCAISNPRLEENLRHSNCAM